MYFNCKLTILLVKEMKGNFRKQPLYIHPNLAANF